MSEGACDRGRVEVEPGLRASAGAPGTRGFRVLGWESAGEIPSAVQGAPKDPEDFSSSILHQGVLTIPRLLLGTFHHHGFLKLSLCAEVPLSFLRYDL